MYSSWSRANAIFSFASSVLGVMLVLNSLSVFLLPPPNPEISFQIHQDSLQILRHKHYKTDAGIFEFSLDADLSSLWNWNTKYVYFYLVAEYETEKSTSNSVIIWDKIVGGPERIHIEKERVEYPLLDFANELRNREITITAHYSVSPISGLIYDSIPTHFALTHPVNPPSSVTIKLPDFYAR